MTILGHLCGSDYTEISDSNHVLINEAAPTSEKDTYRTQDIANAVLDAIFTAEKPGKYVQAQVNDIVSTTGWTQNLAKAILQGLKIMLDKGMIMGQAMLEAVEKSRKAAVGFAKEHPEYLTLIALGVLFLLIPWVLQVLGFTAGGIVEGRCNFDINVPR